MSKTLTDKEKKLLEKWIDKEQIYLIMNNEEGCYQIAVRNGKKKHAGLDYICNEPNVVEYNGEGDDWENEDE